MMRLLQDALPQCNQCCAQRSHVSVCATGTAAHSASLQAREDLCKAPGVGSIWLHFQQLP